MLPKEENELLTRVGPGTPGGELLRRYWHVVGVASELNPEKPKRRVRILGEDLVLFREPNGAYGLVAEHCSHRGASLYYGFLEEGGIRCAYHGWKYDVTGRCLEQPFEKNPRFKEEIRHPAYAVETLAGLLFAYMGPLEKKPLLPKWDILVRQDGTRKLSVNELLRCNWLQAMENSVDPVHTYFLHAHTLRLRGKKDGDYYYRPLEKLEFDVVVEPHWAGIQKKRTFSGSETAVEAPHPLIFPNMLLVPTGDSFNMHFRTPVDDFNTQIFHLSFRPTPGGRNVVEPEDPPAEYVRVKDEAGEFHMDTFPSQDQMAWETQGSVADRTKENLGESDWGITLLRKLLRDQIRIVQQGGNPVGVNRDPALDQVIYLIPQGYTAFGYSAARNED